MPEGIDFAVMPLETLWWSGGEGMFTGESAWSWTAMIMQPDHVSVGAVHDAVLQVEKKKSLPALERLRYERFTEGAAAQVMYVGPCPYRDEGATIADLHRFIGEQGLELAGKHHEIYLGDPRCTAPTRLRTVIRQPVSRPLSNGR